MKITLEIGNDDLAMLSLIGQAIDAYVEYVQGKDESKDTAGVDVPVVEAAAAESAAPVAQGPAEIPAYGDEPTIPVGPASDVPVDTAEPEPEPAPAPVQVANAMTPEEFRARLQERRVVMGITAGTEQNKALSRYVREICEELYGESKPSNLSPERLYNFTTTEIDHIVMQADGSFSIEAPF